MPLEKVWLDILQAGASNIFTVFSEDDLLAEIFNIWGTMCQKEYVTEMLMAIPQKMQSVIDTGGQ